MKLFELPKPKKFFQSVPVKNHNGHLSKHYKLSNLEIMTIIKIAILTLIIATLIIEVRWDFQRFR